MTEVTKITTEELRHGVLAVGVDVVKAVDDGSFVCRQGVLLDADRSNTQPIFVGGQGMNANTGLPLYPGQNIVIPIERADRVFVCANEGPQKLYWMVL